MGQVYLNKKILDAFGIKDGDEVKLGVRGSEVVIRPVKTIDRNTLNLLRY